MSKDQIVSVPGLGFIDAGMLFRQHREAIDKVKVLKHRVESLEILDDYAKGQTRKYQEMFKEQREKISSLEETIKDLQAQEAVSRGAIQGSRKALDAQKEAIRKLEEELEVERNVSRVMESNWISDPFSRPAPPQLTEAIDAVIEEYWRAKDKHGEMTLDGKMTGNPVEDTCLRLAALVEEVGEVAHELTYDHQPDGVEGGELSRLQKELIQVANLALTWASYLIPGPTAPNSVSEWTSWEEAMDGKKSVQEDRPETLLTGKLATEDQLDRLWNLVNDADKESVSEARLPHSVDASGVCRDCEVPREYDQDDILGRADLSEQLALWELPEVAVGDLDGADGLEPVAGILHARMGSLSGQVPLDAGGRARLLLDGGSEVEIRVTR